MITHGFERFSGDRPIGELERAVYLRHVADLKKGSRRGLWFDEEAADRAIEFISRFCCFTKGEYAGRPFALSPWQAFIVRAIFGWMRLPKGMAARAAARVPQARRLSEGIVRRFDSAFLEVARKNGKTELAAAIALYLLIADGEPAAEVYSAATKHDQARLVFDAARRMVKFGRAGLGSVVLALKNSVAAPASDSFFQPLSAEYSSLDGLNIHGAIVDELHAHRNREVLEVLSTATGARRQPLVLVITTAGSDVAGIGYEEHEYALRILRGQVEDDRRFVYIACADSAEKWTDEKELRKANPNWGVSVKPDTIREAVARAVRAPARRRAVLRYHFNLWINEKDAWIDFESWKACAVEYVPEDLRGRPCFAGLDLSKTTDLTALALVFPPSAPVAITPAAKALAERWAVLVYYWCPEAAVHAREGQDAAPFLAWVDSGHIEMTGGGGVDYDAIAARLLEVDGMFDLKQIGFDPWNAHKFISDMENQSGMPEFIRVSQTTKDLNAPMKELERLILTKTFAHNSNPVLDWNVFNCVVRATPEGNIKPDKGASRDLIDGVSAMATAAAVALAHQGESVYLQRGVILL